MKRINLARLLLAMVEQGKFGQLLNYLCLVPSAVLLVLVSICCLAEQ